MKSKMTSLILALFFIGGTALANDPVKEASYVVDTKASTVEWTGSKIAGSPHTGTVAITKGELNVTDGAITGGNFLLDMTSINCTDLSGGMKGKLEGHLKSEDFFGVEKFPTAQLNIKGSDAHDGHMHVNGELTVKGKSNPVTFDATVTEKDGVFTANATITIDRTKYDVRYGSSSFFDDLGDKAIKNEIVLKVALTGKAQ